SSSLPAGPPDLHSSPTRRSSDLRPEPGTTGAALIGRLGAAGGLPTAEEMVEHYGSFSSRDLSAVDWYTVLACFKLGIVLEGTHRSEEHTSELQSREKLVCRLPLE